MLKNQRENAVITKISKFLLLNVAWKMIGRTNMVRVGRYISNEARLDCNNNMDKNGEKIVQSFVAEQATEIVDPIVLDIGANVGLWSKLMIEAASSKQPRIFAFEPCGATYDTLCRNVQQWQQADNITPVQLAMSNESGQQTFYSLGPNEGTNSFHPPPEEDRVAETVPCQTLDDWCLANNVGSVLFAKIDAEGHDSSVIQGAQRMLAEHRIEMLQFEYNHRWIWARHYLRDVFEMIEPHGYVLGKITRLGIEFYSMWHYELESFAEGNYIVAKPQYIEQLPRVEPWFSDVRRVA